MSLSKHEREHVWRVSHGGHMRVRHPGNETLHERSKPRRPYTAHPEAQIQMN